MAFPPLWTYDIKKDKAAGLDLPSYPAKYFLKSMFPPMNEEIIANGHRKVKKYS
jgi:hypothetical protein